MARPARRWSAKRLREKRPAQARSVFWSFASGIKTNRDEWVYDFDESTLQNKVSFFADQLLLHGSRARSADFDSIIKWSRDLKLKLARGETANARKGEPLSIQFRPFVKQVYWVNKTLSDVLTEFHFRFYGRDLSTSNPTLAFLCVHSSNPLAALATSGPFDYCMLKRGNGGTESVPRSVLQDDGSRIDNVTDWGLAHFQKHCQFTGGNKCPPITKESIFQYVYAVLHDPVYREKYAQNLKREFPRIPLYGESLATFWQWANWGAELMALHIGYESVKPFALERTNVPDGKARSAGQSPKPSLKADRGAGSIVIDSETRLSRIPADAWRYQLGNRSALEWVLDQYKEKKPKDPTIREKFDTYRFADYKEHVIDLLARVTTVSVETMRIVDLMKAAAR